MVYFKFLSEITDIGLKTSFKESGVKFTDGSKDFRLYQPNDVKEIQSFKIRTGDVRPQVGGEEICQKNRYIVIYSVTKNLPALALAHSGSQASLTRTEIVTDVECELFPSVGSGWLSHIPILAS